MRGIPDIVSIFKELSVEPSCFIYFFVYGVYTIAAQRLVLQKTCSPDEIPPLDEFCDDPELMGKAAGYQVAGTISHYDSSGQMRGIPDIVSIFKELSVEPSCFIYFFVYGVYTIAAQRLVLQKTCSPDEIPPLDEFCDDPELMGKAAGYQVAGTISHYDSSGQMRGIPDIVSIFKELSVEPSCFIYFFVYGVYTIAAQRLVLQKTCSPDEIPPLDEFCDDPELMGKAADINTVRNVIGESLPGIVVFIAGSWRDASGLSRPLMFYTFLSEFISTGVFLVSSIFWSIPALPMSILESTITGFGGGKQLINLAAVCIISNRTSHKNRTFRLTFFTVAQIAGFCVANAVSGYLLTVMGYVYFFGSIMALLLTAFLLAIIFIKEEPSKLQKGEKWLHMSNLKVIFQKKPNRGVIWLMVINCWLIYATMCGEENVMLYFLERVFSLTVTECGLFLSYLLVMNFLSTIGISPFFIKVVKWSDFSLSTIGIICIIISTIGIAFSRSVILLCVFAAFDVMRYAVITAQRSVITKCVPEDELGSHWSFVGIGESLAPMVTLPIYDVVFKSTLTSLPGSHYFVSAAIALIAIINVFVARNIFKAPKENREGKIDGDTAL